MRATARPAPRRQIYQPVPRHGRVVKRAICGFAGECRQIIPSIRRLSRFATGGIQAFPQPDRSATALVTELRLSPELRKWGGLTLGESIRRHSLVRVRCDRILISHRWLDIVILAKAGIQGLCASGRFCLARTEGLRRHIQPDFHASGFPLWREWWKMLPVDFRARFSWGGVSRGSPVVLSAILWSAAVPAQPDAGHPRAAC